MTFLLQRGSHCWSLQGCVPLVHVSHGGIPCPGADDKKAGRSRVPGQLLSRSDSLCRALVSKPRLCTHVMPYRGHLRSCSMAAHPCTPGFNKPRPPGADVSAGTVKPSEDLRWAPSLLLLPSRAGTRGGGMLPSCSPATGEDAELQLGPPV